MGLRAYVIQDQKLTSDWKESARFVIDGDSLAAYTRTGNVITGNANGFMGNQDGVVPVAGDEAVLDFAAPNVDSGIYVVDVIGDGSNPFQFTRRRDFNADAKVTAGIKVRVEEGTSFGGVTVTLLTANPITVNTTAIDFGLDVGGGGSGSPYVTTAVQSAPGPYNASAFDIVLADPSGGAFTINLPASPTKDDIVGYINVTTDTTTVTVSGNGNNINGSASQSMVDPEQAEMFIYTGSEWRMM